jgi:hypothetical protein
VSYTGRNQISESVSTVTDDRQRGVFGGEEGGGGLGKAGKLGMGKGLWAWEITGEFGEMGYHKGTFVDRIVVNRNLIA